MTRFIYSCFAAVRAEARGGRLSREEQGQEAVWVLSALALRCSSPQRVRSWLRTWVAQAGLSDEKWAGASGDFPGAEPGRRGTGSPRRAERASQAGDAV